MRKLRVNNGKSAVIAAITVLVLAGCTSGEAANDDNAADEPAVTAGSEEVTDGEGADEIPAEPEPEILDFVDVFGQPYQVEINPDVEKHTYEMDAFVHDGDRLAYQADGYEYRLGVDVSEHQGWIDWEKVRNDGYEFAIIRVGYRGYGQEGRVCLDDQFYTNIENAQKAGLDVGVYFFAQAINEEEAKAEAQFVLEHIKGYELQLPVVYDPESILDDEARTDNVSGEQFTKNTEVFCRMIEEAGYEPMIYSNMLWEAYEFDLERLEQYPIWYADYEPLPQTPYHFDFWQYTNAGSVDGITGRTDLNIQLMPAG